MELNPFKIYEKGVRAIPSIRYAMGLVGIIAAAMIAIIVGKSAQDAILSFVFALAGMYLVLNFAGFAKEPGAGRGPAIFATWAITVLFVSMLVMTVTAYAFGVPHGWVRFIGAQTLNDIAGGAPSSTWLDIPSYYNTYTDPTYTAPTISSYNYSTGTTLPTGSRVGSFSAGTDANGFRTPLEKEATARSAQAGGVSGECVAVGAACGPDSMRGLCVQRVYGVNAHLSCSFQHDIAGGATSSSWLDIPSYYNTYTEPTYTAPTISSYNYSTGTTLPTGSRVGSFSAGMDANGFRTPLEKEATARSAQAAGVSGECVAVGAACGPDSVRGSCVQRMYGVNAHLSCSFQHPLKK